MFELDKQQFGAFVADQRRQKQMTQKDLAQKLMVSDKAVSKWELRSEYAGYHAVSAAGSGFGCERGGAAGMPENFSIGTDERPSSR